MKYLKLYKDQINGLKTMIDDDNKTLKVLMLQHYKTDKGDMLYLIADRQDDNSLNILWVNQDTYDFKQKQNSL